MSPAEAEVLLSKVCMHTPASALMVKAQATRLSHQDVNHLSSATTTVKEQHNFHFSNWN
jgi:hypothetical protein